MRLLVASLVSAARRSGRRLHAAAAPAHAHAHAHAPAHAAAPQPQALAPKLACAGCGGHLQTRDVAAAGYIPTQRRLLALQRRSDEALRASPAGTLTAHGSVCQRCFDAKNYGRLLPLAVPTDVYRAYLETLAALPAERASLIMLVLDVWDFHGAALSSTLAALLTPQPQHSALAGGSAWRRPSLLVVLNKADLLPASARPETVLAWARRELRKAAARVPGGGGDGDSSDYDTLLSPAGLAYPPAPRRGRRGDIFGRGGLNDSGAALGGGVLGLRLVSAEKGWGMGALLEEVEALYKGRDVFVVGAPNVGKSSVINSLLSRRWDLPWNAGGKPRLGPGARGASRGGAGASVKAGGTVTLFLDELPEGYRVGDAFKGDLAALAAKVKARVQAAGGESAGDAGDSGDPLRRRGDGYGHSRPPDEGSPIAAPAAGGGTDEELALLTELRARKARHKATKGSAVDDVKDEGASVAGDGSGASVTLSQAPNREGGAGAGVRAPPSVPFTTSPLPGTTLGVIGAPFDPHGHAFLYDTPGIVGDAHKQRLLEGIAAQVEAARAAADEARKAARLVRRASLRGSRGRKSDATMASADAARDADESAGTVAAPLLSPVPPAASAALARALAARPRGGPPSAASVLHLLVPQRRPPLHIFRLRPGRVLFLGGLARLEWRHPNPACHVLLTVCAAAGLGLHATAAAKADDLFSRALALDAASGAPHSSLTLLEEPGGPANILWPRWGPLCQRAELRLADCLSPRARIDVSRLLSADEQAAAATASPAAASSGRDGAADASLLSYLDLDEDEAVAAEGDGDGAETEADTDGLKQGPRALHSRLPPAALAPGASRLATSARRRERKRRALADVVLSGLGWVALSPVEIEGQAGWARTVGLGSVHVRSALGVALHVRAPLLPFEAAGTRPSDWRER